MNIFDGSDKISINFDIDFSRAIPWIKINLTNISDITLYNFIIKPILPLEIQLNQLSVKTCQLLSGESKNFSFFFYKWPDNFEIEFEMILDVYFCDMNINSIISQSEKKRIHINTSQIPKHFEFNNMENEMKKYNRDEFILVLNKGLYFHTVVNLIKDIMLNCVFYEINNSNHSFNLKNIKAFLTVNEFGSEIIIRVSDIMNENKVLLEIYSLDNEKSRFSSQFFKTLVEITSIYVKQKENNSVLDIRDAFILGQKLILLQDYISLNWNLSDTIHTIHIIIEKLENFNIFGNYINQARIWIGLFSNLNNLRELSENQKEKIIDIIKEWEINIISNYNKH